jgi:phenylacetate-CoA ligase
LGRLRLVVTRDGETDVMTLEAEIATPSEMLASAVGASLHSIAKLKGTVSFVVPGTLPNDGKVIADERRYD